ncbi:MGDG synthase family glycosyltransferase [Pseudonocardia halophobica]|uniref:MGDG synthase family glycosyltransferase n=1 Tax=Pseudonocardia halophobica TaxID=29401 RepID=UPI003D8AF607
MTDPQRLLLVTGSLGAGHHAAARAVEERARRLWPGVEVSWTETLDGMGRRAGPVFRAVYAGCIRYLPWLYELYFRLLWHVPFFRGGTRAVIGRWSGRGLEPALREHRPDLVVATFPEGITGLAWLRRRGRLPVPAVALVNDPAPHPLWASPSLDLHLVSTEEGAALLRRAAPGAPVRVAALPVVSAFAPPEEAPRERPRVLVSCGSLAFGDVAAVCAGALDAGADVVVTAGRLPALRRRLQRLAGSHPQGARLTVVDWIDDPATATRESDLVITNGGGATALEALACARPLLLADPIPGHGRANAEVLAAAGLARICRGRAGVAEAVAELRDPGARAVVVKDLRRRLEAHDLDRDVAALADLDVPAVEERLRPQDALFVHAATTEVPQQVGARITVEGAPAEGWVAHLDGLVRARAPHLDLLTRGLAPPRPGRPLRWRPDPAPDPLAHVRREVWRIGPEGDHPSWDAAVTAFFADALDPGLGWELQAACADTGEAAVLARVHHALGDGLAVTDGLIRLLTDENAGTPAARMAAAADGGRGARLRHALTVVRGIASLATAGPVGRSPLVGRSGPGPRRIAVDLDGSAVRRAARAHGVGTTVLVLAALAQTLHEEFDAPLRIRTMVPMTTRTRAGVGSRAGGNRTAAVSVDLPTGPMTPTERIARVDAALAAGSSAGQPEGAAAVLAALGLLPGRVQAPLVRLVYGRRFFHLLASVMPGARRPLHVRGGLITTVQPVLPLADGVGLAVGALHWGRYTCVGITADPAVLPVIEGIPAGLRRSLGSMQLPVHPY